MRILIDLNHPAHVHYYRNFIKIMKERGHSICVISRNKEFEHYLLKFYDISFVGKGSGSNSILGKLLYFVKSVSIIKKESKKFKADLLIGSPYSAISSKLLFKKHIAFGDTDHAKLTMFIMNPFNDVMLTPNSFKKDIGRKHVRFNGFLELCYLHPNYYKPSDSVLDFLNVKKNDNYVILRFVSWSAQHDIGESGLSNESKLQLIKELSKYAKVLITSESDLPDSFKEYKINIPPEKIHDALNYCSLYIGEGATMASECAMLGTPAIYVNSLSAGTLEEQERYGLLYGFRNSKGVLEKALQIIQNPDAKSEHQKKRDEMLKDKIDVTSFMLWFVENYPESFKIMKSNPNYQLRFK